MHNLLSEADLPAQPSTSRCSERLEAFRCGIPECDEVYANLGLGQRMDRGSCCGKQAEKLSYAM